MSASDNHRRAWESLIEQGILVPTGKTRPGRDGRPQVRAP